MSTIVNGEASVSHDQGITKIKDTFDAWMKNAFTQKLLLVIEESRLEAERDAMSALSMSDTSGALKCAGQAAALQATLDAPPRLLKEWLHEHHRARLAESLAESTDQEAANVQGEYEDHVAGLGGGPGVQRGGNPVLSRKPNHPSRVTYADGYTLLRLQSSGPSSRSED